ncbi:G5 domain-containing protein, partial [Clostridium perfringens]
MLDAEKEELKNQGVEFNEGIDEISPTLNSEISDELKINLVKVEVKNELAKESIGFDVVIESDSSLDSGLEQVRQDGTSGEKEVNYEIVYKNGKEFSREIKSSKVVAEPVNKIVVQGTRKTLASRD